MPIKAAPAKACIGLIVWTLMSSTTLAQQSRSEFAVRSYEVMLTRQERLFEIVKLKGTAKQYEEQVWLPTVAMMQAWPEAPPGAKDSYRWCQYALNNFLLFSSDYFANEGRLRNSNATTFNEYMSSRKQCGEAILAPK